MGTGNKLMSFSLLETKGTLQSLEELVEEVKGNDANKNLDILVEIEKLGAKATKVLEKEGLTDEQLDHVLELDSLLTEIGGGLSRRFEGQQEKDEIEQLLLDRQTDLELGKLISDANKTVDTISGLTVRTIPGAPTVSTQIESKYAETIRAALERRRTASAGSGSAAGSFGSATNNDQDTDPSSSVTTASTTGPSNSTKRVIDVNPTEESSSSSSSSSSSATSTSTSLSSSSALQSASDSTNRKRRQHAENLLADSTATPEQVSKALDDLTRSSVATSARRNAEIPFNELRFDKLIGSGAFGKVVKGSWLEKAVAVKVLDASSSQGLSLSSLVEFSAELNRWKALKHANLVELYGSSFDHANHHACFVMELCDTSLNSYLHEDRGIVNIEVICAIGLGLAKGLQYLHSKRIVHLDVKPANILLCDVNTGNAQDIKVKLCDFGLSTVKSESTTQIGAEMGGTPAYIAPEQANVPSRLSQKSDIYSSAIVIWEMVERKRPWEGSRPVSIISAVLTGKRPPLTKPSPTYPTWLLDVIETCWQEDRARRLTATQLVEVFLYREYQPSQPVDTIMVDLQSPKGISGSGRGVAPIPEDVHDHLPLETSTTPKSPQEQEQEQGQIPASMAKGDEDSNDDGKQIAGTPFWKSKKCIIIAIILLIVVIVAVVVGVVLGTKTADPTPAPTASPVDCPLDAGVSANEQDCQVLTSITSSTSNWSCDSNSCCKLGVFPVGGTAAELIYNLTLCGNPVSINTKFPDCPQQVVQASTDAYTALLDLALNQASCPRPDGLTTMGLGNNRFITSKDDPIIQQAESQSAAEKDPDFMVVLLPQQDSTGVMIRQVQTDKVLSRDAQGSIVWASPSSLRRMRRTMLRELQTSTTTTPITFELSGGTEVSLFRVAGEETPTFLCSEEDSEELVLSTDGDSCFITLSEKIVLPSQPPTNSPTTATTTSTPTTSAPTSSPIDATQPTGSPTTGSPTISPTSSPTSLPSTSPSQAPSSSPTLKPTDVGTVAPSSSAPTSSAPTSSAPTSSAPTASPSPLPTLAPLTSAPTSTPTAAPSTLAPTVESNVPAGWTCDESRFGDGIEDCECGAQDIDDKGSEKIRCAESFQTLGEFDKVTRNPGNRDQLSTKIIRNSFRCNGSNRCEAVQEWTDRVNAPNGETLVEVKARAEDETCLFPAKENRKGDNLCTSRITRSGFSDRDRGVFIRASQTNAGEPTSATRCFELCQENLGCHLVEFANNEEDSGCKFFVETNLNLPNDISKGDNLDPATRCLVADVCSRPGRVFP